MSPSDPTPSPADPVAHPTVDELADLDAGVLDEVSAGSARAHLSAGCARCAQVFTALSAVRIDLAALPPAHIPADVAARLDAAMAEAAAAAPGTKTELETARDARGARRPRVGQRGERQPAWLGRAAAAVLVLAVGGTAVSLLAPESGPGAGSTPDSAQSAASALSAPTVTPAPLERTAAAPLDTALPPNVALTPAVTESGRDYDAGALAAAAPELAAAAAPTDASFEAGSGPSRPAGAPLESVRESDVLGPLRDPRRLAACLAALGGGSPGQPVAVDYAAYQGVPALIVVLPDLPDTGQLSVSVVGPGCRADAADLRYVASVPRR